MLSWLFAISGVVASYVTESFLPPELRSYLNDYESAPYTNGEIALIIVDIISVVFAFALTVGLFFFKGWAKTLLPLSYTIGLLLVPFNGPYVEVGWDTFLFYLSCLMDGVVLALVYFSTLKEAFEPSHTV